MTIAEAIAHPRLVVLAQVEDQHAAARPQHARGFRDARSRIAARGGATGTAARRRPTHLAAAASRGRPSSSRRSRRARRAASAFARSSTSSDRSMPMTRAAQRAASIVRYPSPQPMSATSSGGSRWPSARAHAAQLRPGTSCRGSPCVSKFSFRSRSTSCSRAVVRADRSDRVAGRFEMRAASSAHSVRLAVGSRILGDAVIDVAGLALLGDETRVLEQAEMPRHARLRNAEDPVSSVTLKRSCASTRSSRRRVESDRSRKSGRGPLHRIY